jgi:hypothetical protein
MGSEVHSHVHKYPSLDHVLSQMSPVYTFTLGILVISLLLTVRFPKSYVFFWFRNYNFVYIFQSCFVLRVLPIKFFEVPYSVFGFFISHSVECSPQHVVHRCHHICSSLSLRVHYSKFEVFHDGGYSDCVFLLGGGGSDAV